MSTSERFDYGDKEDQFDKLTDQGFTPERARAMLGIKAISAVSPSELPSTPSDHKPATPKAAAGVQYGDGGRIETSDGRPIIDSGSRPTEEEQARTHHYAQNWREVGRKAIQDGTHETTD